MSRPKVGTIRRPSLECATWKHDRSMCYDKFEERICGREKHKVWVLHCVELDAVAEVALRGLRKIGL